MQRVRLNYEEDEIPVDAVQAWQLMLTRPTARIDSNILHSGIKQGKNHHYLHFFTWFDFSIIFYASFFLIFIPYFVFLYKILLFSSMFINFSVMSLLEYGISIVVIFLTGMRSSSSFNKTFWKICLNTVIILGWTSKIIFFQLQGSQSHCEEKCGSCSRFSTWPETLSWSHSFQVTIHLMRKWSRSWHPSIMLFLLTWVSRNK